IASVHAGEMKNISTMNNRAFFEAQIQTVTRTCIGAVEKVALGDIDVKNNRMLNMIDSGSKGQPPNIIQMLGCLGQQIIDNQRIPDGFDHRTLPHFTKYDDGPQSRGFVEHSFVEGLTPQEFFFHSMAGRVGLIDTAVRSVTWETRVLVMEGSRAKEVRIGEWIDGYLEGARKDVQLFPEDRNLELLELKEEVFIPTVDDAGRVTWGRLTAVTRHDPGERLYRVKTRGGREVTVAESKSLLVWQPETRTFLAVDSREVRVGDCLPVVARLPAPPAETSSVDIAEYLPSTCPRMSKVFELDWDNGAFIGLFLAGRNSEIDAQDERMARFLEAFVGTGAQKHVPAVAFNAPIEFVRGLLSGYFSYTVSYTASSPSRRLIEGIALLCSRLGASTLLTDNTVVVESVKSCKLLDEELDLLVDEVVEHERIEEHEVSMEQEDVVLDPIESIEVIGVEDHPKLYDVTVPSTLNFVLFNGLGCRDTSETGYIQRKLVTFMQDLKVHADLSVRNSAGQIVQFLYGEDGIDATKVEYQLLPYIEADVAKMREDHLLLNLPEVAGYLDETVLERPLDRQRMTRFFEQLAVDREFAIRVKKGRVDNQVQHPVNIAIMVARAAEVLLSGAASDLHPEHVLDAIDELIGELTCTPAGKCSKYMAMLLRCHLSPKQLIRKRFTRAVFDVVVKQIRTRFFESIAHAGEMVGILAAQSIGEPTTQTTLNSVHYDTELLLRIDGTLTRVKIGEFVEGKMREVGALASAGAGVDQNVTTRDAISQAHSRIEKHPNDTTLVWLKDGGDDGPVLSGVEVLSCDEDGKVTWLEVTAATRHPVANEDGTNTLLEVTTESGRSVTATKGESFLMRKDNAIVTVKGAELVVGDFLPVSDVFPIVGDPRTYLDVSMYVSKYLSKYLSTYLSKEDCKGIPEQIPLDIDFGFFVGAYLAKGSVSPNQIQITINDTAYQKRITDFCDDRGIDWHIQSQHKNGELCEAIYIRSTVLALLVFSLCMINNNITSTSYDTRFPAALFDANDDFIKGVIDGYFSGEGSIGSIDSIDKIGSAVKAMSMSNGLLQDIRQLLLRFSIRSSVTSNDLSMRGHDALLFAETFPLTSTLDLNFEHSKRYTEVPGVTLSTGPTTVIREAIDVTTAASPEDRAILEKVKAEDIIYDRIISIKEVANTHTHAFDLTVRFTRNFNTLAGVCMRDTFHLAGWGAPSIATQQGVPRLQELFHVSKNIKTPYMRIFVKDPWSTDMNRCRDVCSAVQTTRFSDVVQESKVYYDPPTHVLSNVVEDRPLLRAFRKYTLKTDPQCSHESPWVLRFEFDRTKMLELQVSMLDLEMVLRDFYDDTIICMFSDDNAADLVARVRLNSKDVDTNDLLTELRALEENILGTVWIKGVKHIQKAVPLKPSDELVFDPMTGTFVKRSEWAVETSGTNLIEVLALPHVDPVRTYTNDINEIYRVLGIEAARQALYNELQTVMWQNDTNAVDFRHMALLVDAMTSRGFLTSVNRHGINKGDIGPLAKCSFEQTTEMLIQAGVFAEVDRINGVAANVMLGQVAPCGTGDSEILIDEAALQRQGHEVPLPAATRSPDKDLKKEVLASSAPQLPNYKPAELQARGKVEADEIEIT
ncbi:DNA-directed RNA polymerase II subunit RPB1, partial [Tetrabaena socialis]